MESKLDPEEAARLAATVASLEAGKLYRALQAEITLFRDLRGSLFETYGLTFDPEPQERVTGEMSRIWATHVAQACE